MSGPAHIQGPTGYLVLFDEQRSMDPHLWGDALQIRGSCYQLSIACIDTRAERKVLDKTVTAAAIEDSRFPLLQTVRADMASELVMASPQYQRQCCVLIPEQMFREMEREIARGRKWSRTWKRLAKRLLARTSQPTNGGQR